MNSKVTTVPAHAGDSKQSIYFDTVQNSEAEKPTNSGAQVISFPKVHTVPKELHIGKETNKTPLRKQYPSEYSSWHNRKYTARKRGWVWHPDFDKFANFLKIMGPKPNPSYTLDRKDSANPEYSPENCRWASKSLQSANRRGRRLVSYMGFELSVSEWAKRTEIPAGTIRARLNSHWTPEKALTTPPRWAQKDYSDDIMQSIADAESSAPYTEIWERVMRDKHGQNFVVFKAKDKKMLKDIAKLFSAGDLDPQEALEGILTNWSGFCCHANMYGAIGKYSPDLPSIEFLTKWINAAGNYCLKAKENAVQQAKIDDEQERQRLDQNLHPENWLYIDNLGNLHRFDKYESKTGSRPRVLIPRSAVRMPQHED